MQGPSRISDARAPEWLDDASDLVQILARKTPKQLGKLMGISDKLATLNAERFSEWQAEAMGDAEHPGVRPAIEAFRGDVYTGLDVDTLSSADLDYADQHLRLLSGLYGILKPKDLMLAYRLEMGTALKNPRGKDLYAYWGEQVTDKLQQELADHQYPAIVNAASKEYSSVVRQSQLEANLITPVFHDESQGRYKVISFFAKKARGALARYLVTERADTPEAVKDFKALGYRYIKSQSTPEAPLFRRTAKVADRYRAS